MLKYTYEVKFNITVEANSEEEGMEKVYDDCYEAEYIEPRSVELIDVEEIDDSDWKNDEKRIGY